MNEELLFPQAIASFMGWALLKGRLALEIETDVLCREVEFVLLIGANL